MLFQHFDFNDKETAKKFRVDEKAHSVTWKHYYSSYTYCLRKIFSLCLTQNYAFNPKARAVMFILRHSLELCYKYNLEREKASIPLSHSFSELETAFKKFEIPLKFTQITKQIAFDEDGACYRYLQKKDGTSYFTYEDKIHLANIAETYSSISSSGFSMDSIAKSFDYKNRRLQWDLTLHLGECHTLGQIRTQYDNTIELLIDGVILNNIDINKIYLPLLYLVRHSLELALKDNIIELQRGKVLSEKDINSEHSLVRLYNIYSKFLEALDKSQLPEETANQLTLYQEQYKQLNDTIHNLDTNSRYFRFPVDGDGKAYQINLKKLKLIEILKLYYLTDPFITFTNYVLEDHGVIRLDWPPDPY